MKRVLYIGIILVLLLVLVGCENSKTENTAKTIYTKTSENKTENKIENKVENKSKETSKNTVNSEKEKADYKAFAEKQMSKPKKGETVAIIKVKNFGDIKVKFFPEIAPKAVENFITHSKEGYYNGVTFHRVIDEFMIQGGDPEGTGSGGESIWGEGFGPELDASLVPYRGSLCMAMSSRPNSIGSQFFITQANYSEKMGTYLKQSGYPEDLLEQYKNYGGYLSLYMQYTVFGQVYEGMDVVDKIVKVEKVVGSDGAESKPVEDIVIENIKVMEY